MQYSAVFLSVFLFLSVPVSGLVPSQVDAGYSGTLNKEALDIVMVRSAGYIQSALFAEEILHFDDLYFIRVQDGEVPIIIFCNRSYCYRPEDAVRYV